MANITELAAEKVRLQDVLTAHACMNVYGRTTQELIDAQVAQIEASRRLFEVERQIQNYIEGKS